MSPWCSAGPAGRTRWRSSAGSSRRRPCQTQGDDGGGYADDLACTGCCILLSESDLVPEGTDPNPGWSPPARTEPVLFAEAALDAIAALLDGRRWLPADDLEAIADTLRKTGRRNGEQR